MKFKKTIKKVHFSYHKEPACGIKIKDTEGRLAEDWNDVTCLLCPKVNFYI